VQHFAEQPFALTHRFYHRAQLGHEVVKRRVEASERYRVYRAVAVLIDIKAPGSSFDFAIRHQLVNDLTRVPKSVIVVPEADAGLIFDVAAPVQYLESVSRHALPSGGYRGLSRQFHRAWHYRCGPRFRGRFAMPKPLVNVCTPEWHTAQLVLAARKMLDAGGTIEDALDAVIEAAKRQFGVRVIFTAPAEIRIDGFSYRWPETMRHV